jgi:hypothetical protein
LRQVQHLAPVPWVPAERAQTQVANVVGFHVAPQTACTRVEHLGRPIGLLASGADRHPCVCTDVLQFFQQARGSFGWRVSVGAGGLDEEPELGSLNVVARMTG